VQLLALWAAYSPRPWLLRTLVVWTPIALLATIRAYEPAILLLMSAALTIGICLAVERFKSPRTEDDRPPTPLWRFRLSDLLVLVLFLATWLALTRPGAVWIGSIYSLYFAAFALPFAVLTVFVHRAVIGPWRWTMAALALGTIWFCALVLRYHDVPQYLGEGRPSMGFNWPRGEAFWATVQGSLPLALFLCLILPMTIWRALQQMRSSPLSRITRGISVALSIVIGITTVTIMWDDYRGPTPAVIRLRYLDIAHHTIFFLAFAGFVAVATCVIHTGWGSVADWRRQAARGLAVALGLFVAVPGAWLYWQMHGSTPYPKGKTGPANHYERIVQIAKEFPTANPVPAPLTQSQQKLLDELVILLRDHNYMPEHVFESHFSGVNGEPQQSESFVLWNSSLPSMFDQAAKDSWASGQKDHAADYAAAIIRLYVVIDCSGVTGYGFLGEKFLANHRREISPAKSREIIQSIEQTFAQREGLDIVRARQEVGLERHGRWRSRLRSIVAPWSPQPPSLPFDPWQSHRESIALHETRLRLLQTELAIHAFQNERGAFPQRLDELTPAYLPAVPVDPYSGRPLVYRNAINRSSDSQSRDFVLYSVGPDGIDDGGKFVTQPLKPGENYDLRLEPLPGL
jgi:hypothetical protein